MTVPTQTQTQTTNYLRLSASCQQVVGEALSDTRRARVVVRSTIADPQILPSISQHLCNGTALTPSGLYADMAEVVAKYIWRADRGRQADIPGINVSHMEVDKTYIIKLPQEGSGQWLEMEAIMNVPESSCGDIIDGTITCYFRSIKPDGKKMNDLAHCSVQYEWLPGWHMSWSNLSGPLKTKIDNLNARAVTERSGEVRHMHRQKAYEEFKSFVDYGPKYQNMAEVVCDTKTLEATALLDFQPDPVTDYLGPYYLDGSCHISGFVCNAMEQDRGKNAYISHGWDAMKISPSFDPTKSRNIRNHVHMQPLPNDPTVFNGDVYVLQDDQIVGVWEGVKFKRIPRRILNVFLPPPKK